MIYNISISLFILVSFVLAWLYLTQTYLTDVQMFMQYWYYYVAQVVFAVATVSSTLKK